MKKLFVVAILSFSSPLAFSQGTFPLHVGDTWNYWWMNTNGFLGQSGSTVAASVSIKGQTYFPSGQPNWPFYFLRHSGDTLKALLRDSSAEVTVFHRWLTVGDTLEWDWAGYQVYLKHIDTTQASFGDSLTKHARWILATVPPPIVDWTIEDSMGVVAWTEGALTGAFGGLTSAVIGGRHYGPTTSVSALDDPLPIAHVVVSAYPNPFNSQTTVLLTTAKAGLLRLTLHDLLGRELQLLRTEPMTPGTAVISISLSGYSSGVYLLRASVDEQSVAKRLMLLR